VLDSTPSGPFRSHRLPDLSSRTVANDDARDFVAGSSSPAAPSRSSRTVSRTARRWLLGNTVIQKNAPDKGMARRASFMITASPVGRGGGRPIRARSGGGSSAPLEATRGRESGNLRCISGVDQGYSGLNDHRLRYTSTSRRAVTSHQASRRYVGSSDEHGTKHRVTVDSNSNHSRM